MIEEHGTAHCRVTVNEERRLAYMYNLCSSSPGNGDGGRLLAAIIAECEERNLELRLHAEDPQLVAWYLRYGFQTSGDPHPFWGWELVKAS